MSPDRIGRRLLAALAGSSPAFTRQPVHGTYSRRRRFLSALAGTTPAFTHGGGADQHLSSAPAEETLPDVFRVFVVVGNPMIRYGTAALLAGEPDLEVVGEAATAADALALIPALAVDVVVLDGTDVVETLKADMPGIACVLLAADDSAVLDAPAAGVAGVVLKDSPGAALVAATRAAGKGENVLPADVVARLLDQVSRTYRPPHPGLPLGGLTTREQEILSMIAEGRTDQEIAAQLYVSRRTVRHHLTNIRTKLGLPRHGQAPLGSQPAEQE